MMMMVQEAVESSAVDMGFGLEHRKLGVRSCWENSDGVVSVLPKHTKVVVTGNNRTKSVLIGLQGVVKKAVGLGGWHWLVLTNGIEVKLQRNALTVIESPTGNEEEDDLELDNTMWNGSVMTSDDTQRPHQIRLHKTLCRSDSYESHSKGSVPSRGSVKPDLSMLEIDALWRYWQHFNLVKVFPNPSKKQLIEVVQAHFMSQQIDELQVIVSFVKAAKRLKST